VKVISYADFQSVREALTLPNPAYEKDLQLVARGIKRFPSRGISPTIQLWEPVAGGVTWGYGTSVKVPFGAWPTPASPGAAGPPAWLRPYQAEAVSACLAWDSGVVVAPCGAGKTQIGCGIIRAAPTLRASLVIVHTQDLVNQWVERLKSLGLGARKATGAKAWADAERAVVAQERCDTVVTTVQTLRAAGAPRATWGVVIVDEAHHTPASTYTQVLGRLNMLRCYGLTATPEREDGMGPVMLAYLGPVRYTVDRAHLVDIGASVVPKVVKVETGRFTMGASDFSGMVAELAGQPERDAIVWDMVRRHGAFPQLVLTSLVSHAEGLVRAAPEGVTCEAITGTTRGREEALQRVRDGEVQVLVATQLADEGLDLPELSAVHLALPSRAAGRTEQRVGRIMRPAPGKPEPVVYDYVDDDSLCVSQWRSRRKVYQQLGVTRWRTERR
jgi:superfamily II DNA or RNA helicase